MNSAAITTLSKEDDVLMRLSDKLNSLKSIQYEHRRELNYPSTSFFNELSGKVYLNFTSVDKVLGAHYYFQGGYLILAFNGSESFICNDVDQSIVINRSPKSEDMETLSFLNHSVLSLKKALPWIIADHSLNKKITDTLVGNKQYYLVSFTLTKSVINTLGKRESLTNDIDMVYKILVDRNTYLPAGVYQTNNRSNDFLTTTFTNIRVDTDLESESVLYYSSYLGRYKEKVNVSTPLVRPGSMSFGWELSDVDSRQPVSLSDLKGKVVLLDFWICNCSYCILQIPELNAIHEKYIGKNFRLFGVNAYDSLEMIKVFREKRSPMNYSLLYKGDAVRLKYGIEGFPTVVLFGKNGIVLYAGAFDRKIIEMLIEKNL